MSSDEYLIFPTPAPPLRISSSTSTVTVRVIDSTTTLQIDPKVFWRPQFKCLDAVQAPVYCFLISNENRHILFDPGVRRDWENYAPKTVDLIRSTTTVQTRQNISEILDSDPSDLNIRSSDISAITWSHHHFDHIGDPSTFPLTTPLVVGPGFKSLYQPAYPFDPSSLILDSDTKGRPIHELNFSIDLHVGGFPAVDYFDDGSFYILDAPGHASGHLCALARVTSSPDSFIFMGADACHDPGLLRPTPYLPLPRTVEGYSGAALQGLQPRQSATEPFLKPSERMFPALAEAEETIQRIAELDAQPNVFVVLAHDTTLKGEMEIFPNTVNGWMGKDVKDRTRWLFIRDFAEALT